MKNKVFLDYEHEKGRKRILYFITKISNYIEM